ncbi:Glycosyl transferase group 1 [Burkholderia multivorans]
MKKAIVHDYLVQMGGAEQVVATLHRMYPDACVYTSVVNHRVLMDDLRGARLVDTWLRFLPTINRNFKKYFPLFPLAFRSLGKINADVAIVSSSGFSKWARFTQSTTSICYCHTPPRFFWIQDSYLDQEIKSRTVRAIVKPILAVLRKMDYRAAQRISFFVANSQCVKDRIRDFYNRKAVVIYPPVRVSDFEPSQEHKGYYLIVSRLVGYKRIDIAVRAFSKNGRRLVVVGDGPDRVNLEKMAAGNVEFTGRVSRDEVKRYMSDAYAFVFPGLEDFGIAPIEANACGKPVLAYGGGGALETIIPGKTGMFFHSQVPDAINETLDAFEAVKWSAEDCAAQARKFSEERFMDEMENFVRLSVSPGRDARHPPERSV